MTSAIRHVTVDSFDAYALGSFWAEVLGEPLHDDDKPGDPEALIEGAGLLFVTVPEAKSVKNRVHLDIQPQDRTRDEEVERLLALGATLVDDQRRPRGAQRGGEGGCGRLSGLRQRLRDGRRQVPTATGDAATPTVRPAPKERASSVRA